MQIKQKHAWKYLFAGLMLVGIMAGLPVSAQSPSQVPPDEARKQRIDERKQQSEVAIDDAKQARLKQRCKNAQGKITEVTAKMATNSGKRTDVFQLLHDKLSAFEPHLAAAGADTSQLRTEMEELTLLIEAYESGLTDFDTLVSDTVLMDCQADPLAFQVLLEDMRALLQKRNDDAAAVRKHITETILPSLQTIKQNLQTETEGAE